MTIQKNNHINRLTKDDKRRHFSNELWGGKGDCRYRGRRGQSQINAENDNYRNNPFWEDVDQKRERELQQKEAEKRMMREEKARLSRELSR